MRSFYLLCLIFTGLALGACAEPTPDAEVEPGHAASNPPDYQTSIRWTSYGIPHVQANDWASLGYGFAYATATDAVCVIAKDVAMVNGSLSQHFGSEEGNLVSDVFHTAVLDAAKVAAFDAAQSNRSNQFSQGYAAGFNRYLRDHAGQLPASCNTAAWVRPINQADVTRLSIGVGIRYGLGRFQKEIAGAAPASEIKQHVAQQTQWRLPAGIGSNAVAIGADLAASGRGMLLGNPHYPWHGSSRFHLIHSTIPGEVDVMGTSLLTTSRVAIGFNKDIAWTHTVSTAMRFTLYELELNPEDPMQYRYDDDFRPIETRSVTIKVKQPDGSLAETTEPVFFTHYGPVIENENLPWTADRAYALRDAVIDNYTTADTYDALSKARTTAEVEAAISQQGIYWTNTIAADRHGNAFYADISGTPNVDQALLETCQVRQDQLPRQLVVLDGSRSACEWHEDPRSVVAGALPPQDMPRMTRRDYVSNSNDSYWLSNPEQPLEGYSPIIGTERTARSLRTRAGLSLLSEMIADDQKIAPEDLKHMLYSHRNYGAELLLDDLLTYCGQQPDIAAACQALSAWDRTMTIDSSGGHLWREFWDKARHIENLYAVPFDVNDPVATPHTLNMADAEVANAVHQALLNAQNTLAEANIELDARLGDIQYAPRNGTNIPIPGGEGWAGMFSMTVTELEPNVGYSPIRHGNSYIQVVSWDTAGNVQPSAMLTYAQSPEPDSPHYADLTQIYAQGGWINLPFSDEEIEADTNLRRLELVE